MTPEQLVALQVGGQLGAQGINAGNNYFSFRRNKKFYWERWNKQNKYNHPVQQMARLKEAGLNPALMYGKSGGTGNASPMSAPDHKPVQFGDPNFGLAFSQMELQKSQVELQKTQQVLNAQKTATEQKQTALTEAQAGKTRAEKEEALVRASKAEDIINSSLEYQKAITNKANKDANLTQENYTQLKGMREQNLEKAKLEVKTLEEGLNMSRLNQDNVYAQTKFKELEMIYEALKIDAQERGAPIDKGPLGVIIGMYDTMSKAIHGKTPKMSEQFMRDYYKFKPSKKNK